MDRVILHCDINNFYASVELLEHPELAGKPVAVSGSSDNRHGIILAKNQLAKSYGVKTAETIWQARKKCPDLVFLPPHHEKYHAFHERFNAIFLEYTDQVEPFSIDESWLDVTESLSLFGSGKAIADEIRTRVFRELGITLSAGVSFNKTFAKMGSEYKKPNATTVISRDNFRQLLWPLPVSEFFFVGAVTARRLNQIGIQTIGDLAGGDSALLQTLLGKQGPQLKNYALGLDREPVARYDEQREVKSVGNGITFPHDLTTWEEILREISGLADTVARRLRRGHLKVSGVKVDIKNPQFKTITRQKQLDTPTNLAEELKTAALDIIRANWRIGDPIRLLTLTGIYLSGEQEEEQLSFFGGSRSQEHQRNESMERTMDQIREKFGDSAIQYGDFTKRK